MIEKIRIAKLRLYLLNVIDTIKGTTNSTINADMLSNDINSYSLDKIPTSSTVEKWINGIEIHKDLFSFRSRCSYSQDTINNLSNIGFFEKFENVINSNNKEGILPEIENIEEIQCLNCGTLTKADTNTAEFDIQIQITYIINSRSQELSL